VLALTPERETAGDDGLDCDHAEAKKKAQIAMARATSVLTDLYMEMTSVDF
jgi:dUTPase